MHTLVFTELRPVLVKPVKGFLKSFNKTKASFSVVSKAVVCKTDVFSAYMKFIFCSYDANSTCLYV